MKKRNPNREKSYEIWKESLLQNNKIKLKDIAKLLGEKDSRIRKWKCEDNWEGRLIKENPKGKLHPEKARYGNKNSIGNSGGAPKGSQNNMKHGFYSKILPEEALEIAKDIEIKKPLDILWENIIIQYVAIARAQKIMYVKNNKDISKEVKRTRNREDETDKEYEIQFAWDKHGNFLQAQSRAMATLQSMISKYNDLLNSELVTENEKLRMEKLKIDILKLKGEDEIKQDDDFIKALNKKAAEVWNNEE